MALLGVNLCGNDRLVVSFHVCAWEGKFYVYFAQF